MRLDQGAQIQIFGCAFGFAVAAEINAIGHGLILQIAFAALIADRAIQRVVDQQEFHHTLTGLFDHRAVGFDNRRLAFGTGAQILDLHRTACCRFGRATHDLDQTHPTVTRNRQPLVIAEARDFNTRLLTGLNERHRPFGLYFLAVDDDLADVAHMLTSLSVTSRSGSIFESLPIQAHNSFAGQKYRPPAPGKMSPPLP
jgi:hypothetical protein